MKAKNPPGDKPDGLGDDYRLGTSQSKPSNSPAQNPALTVANAAALKAFPELAGNVNTTIAGRRFGDLVTAYADSSGKRIACRCRCTRLIFVHVEDLASGVVTSCGCSPPSLINRVQLRELAVEMRRVVSFNIAKRRA